MASTMIGGTESLPVACSTVAIEIREALPDEHDETGRVTALAYREFAAPEDDDWDGYLRHIADVAARAPRTTVLVAVEDGAILGSATLELEGRIDPEHTLADDEAHVRMLGVHPDARGRGIAKALMRACIDRSLSAGKTRLTLNTTDRMQLAQRMYESLGFERGPDEVFPDGFVLLSYELRLRGT